jgi:hypothetical protein
MENFRSHLPAGALPPYFDQLPFNHRSDVGSMVHLSLALSLSVSLSTTTQTSDPTPWQPLARTSACTSSLYILMHALFRAARTD